jgi:hypothetical protein
MEKQVVVPVDSFFFKGQVIKKLVIMTIVGEEAGDSSAWWDWFTHRDDILVGS